jgi:signal transduction histidine kinase
LEKSRRLQLELRELSHQLLKAQEDERMKISRELHDVIAQTLTGINVNLDILKKQSSADNKQLQQKIRKTQLLVEKSVDIVHRFACELRPTVLDDLGLIPALKSFLKSTKAESGLHLSLGVSAEIEKSGNQIRTALYRVVQEAITNVSRHANATHASIQIQCRSKKIFMTISDNGRGMELEDLLGTKLTTRLGLLGMRERIEMVGGKFSMESVKGESTTVRAEIPS